MFQVTLQTVIESTHLYLQSGAVPLVKTVYLFSLFPSVVFREVLTDEKPTLNFKGTLLGCLVMLLVDVT